MTSLLNLYRLQQVDSRIDQIHNRLDAIHSILENDAELKAAKQVLADAETAEHKAASALKKAEDETASQRIKIEHAESSLYSGRIQNPKELQDLQNDLASLKRYLAVLEDQQLEAMLEIESAREALALAHKNFDSTQGRIISQNSGLKTEEENLQKEAENFAAQRLAVLPTIDAASLALYDSLRQKRRGVAVSTISDNACDSCGTLLTPAQAQIVRISANITHCPLCGRILFAN